MAVRKFSAEYESKYGEKPSVRKIAEALKLSEEEVVKALEVGGVVSLDSSSSGEDGEGETNLYGAIADEDDA
jgi:DNA-directed RNA polymerase specialized sigma subunit